MAKAEEVKTLNLFQRINLVMKQVDTVNKGTTVDMGNNRSYSAVSHDDVTALLHKPITEAGLAAVPSMDSAEVEATIKEKTYNGNTNKSTEYLVKVWASVTFVNIDNPEEKFTTKCYAYALDSGDKATGKAYSMAVKYCYLKTFMLESADDEESRDNENNWQNSNYGKNASNGRSGNANQSRGQAERTGSSNPPADRDNASRGSAGTPTGGAPASDAQKNALKKMGISFADNVTKQQASDLIKNAQNAKRN